MPINSIKTRFIAFCTAAMLSFAVTSHAQAVVICSDDFNRPDNNTVGNCWTESIHRTMT